MSIWVGQYEPLELFCLWTKVHHFFAQRGRGSGWSSFSDVRSVDPFRRYMRSKSKVIKIAPKFGSFWPSEIFQNVYALYHPCRAARCLEKFRGDIPTSPEIIGAHTLNFKPNFKFSRLFFFGGEGDPVTDRVCARWSWSISSAFKNFRAQHPLMAKM